MATFLAACMLMGAVPATAFAAKETTEAAETIPQVYRMDDDNDTVRLVIGKTPTLYIGKNGTVSVTLMNMEDKDWVETEIWIASEDDKDGGPRQRGEQHRSVYEDDLSL